jgi:uncharacterized protein (TIGR02145 family)
MKKTIITILTIAFIGLSTATAQVGIGTETPDPSATLDLTSSSQGFLPPRMTEAQRNNITTPATGLMVYCTNCGTDGELQVYNGTTWTNLVGGATAAVPIPTVIGANGVVWMDRNLGATQVATSSTDADSYGDLYQWGRAADGHQIRTSGTTNTLSTTDTPGHGDFILINNSDWRNPQNNTLWQGVNGINNPCPSGYRLPAEAEWEAERASWGTNNAAGAFASPLKLPVAGSRKAIDGSLIDVGADGYYWSSTVSGNESRHLDFGSNFADMAQNSRAFGGSVRCLKD